MDITHIQQNAITWYEGFQRKLVQQDFNANVGTFHWTRKEEECRNLLIEAIDKSTNQNKGVLIVCAHSEFDTVMVQFISVYANIERSHLHNYMLDEDEWARLNETLISRLDIPLYIGIADKENASIDICKIGENNISVVYFHLYTIK